MTTNFEEKEKKRKSIFQIVSKKEDNIINKVNNKVSRSNQNLISIKSNNNKNLSSEKVPFLKNKEEKLSIKIPKLDIFEKEKEIFKINSTSNEENNGIEKFKSKIIGKKFSTFTKYLEEKNNILIELVNKFISKIIEIHNKLNLLTKNKNDLDQIKNSFKLLNLNKIFIYEEKINEFIKKRILFYKKIINNIDSFYLVSNNINFEFLNDFYKDLEKEENPEVKIGDKANLIKKIDVEYTPKLKKIDKFFDNEKIKNSLLSSYNEANIKTIDSNFCFEKENLNTERNNKVSSKFRKLLLPSLKNIISSENQLNPNSFRNSQKNKNSISTDKSKKKYDLFNKKECNIKELFEQKIENNNNNNNLKEEENIKKNNLENTNKNSKLNNDLRRKSIIALTVPDYQNINNVNDYIINYNQIKEENEIVDIGEIIRNREQLNKNKIINKNNIKLKLKTNTVEKEIENNNINNNKKSKEINIEDNNINKESEEFNSENSQDSNENSQDMEEKKLKNKNESSIDSKDPLDDIKYLKKFREKNKNIEYLQSEDDK